MSHVPLQNKPPEHLPKTKRSLHLAGPKIIFPLRQKAQLENIIHRLYLSPSFITSFHQKNERKKKSIRTQTGWRPDDRCVVQNNLSTTSPGCAIHTFFAGCSLGVPTPRRSPSPPERITLPPPSCHSRLIFPCRNEKAIFCARLDFVEEGSDVKEKIVGLFKY